MLQLLIWYLIKKMNYNIPVSYSSENQNLSIGYVTHAGSIKIYVTDEQNNKTNSTSMDTIHKGAESLVENILSHAHKFSIIDTEQETTTSCKYSFCDCLNNWLNYLCNIHLLFDSTSRIDFFNKKLPELNAYNLREIINLLKFLGTELESDDNVSTVTEVVTLDTEIVNTSDNTNGICNFNLLINEDNKTADLQILDLYGKINHSKKCRFYLQNFSASSPNLEIKFNLRKNNIDLNNTVMLDHIKKNMENIQFGNACYRWCNTLSNTSISEDLIK